MSHKLFKVNGNLYYNKDSHVEKNTFLTMQADTAELPIFDDIKDKLPIPI